MATPIGDTTLVDDDEPWRWRCLADAAYLASRAGAHADARDNPRVLSERMGAAMRGERLSASAPIRHGQARVTDIMAECAG